jgi:hypothetical protein
MPVSLVEVLSPPISSAPIGTAISGTAVSTSSGPIGTVVWRFISVSSLNWPSIAQTPTPIAATITPAPPSTQCHHRAPSSSSKNGSAAVVKSAPPSPASTTPGSIPSRRSTRSWKSGSVGCATATRSFSRNHSP